MLASFTVERYKPFVDRFCITLKPLTLFFGYNNVGKSALLRVLPLLADSLLDGGRSPFKRGAASRGGTFEDLLSRVEPTTRPLTVGLSWKEQCFFEVGVKDLPERHRQVIDRLSLGRGDLSIDAHWLPREDGAGRLSQWYEVGAGSSREEVRIEMKGLIPYLREDQSPDTRVELFSKHRADLLRIAAGIQWISSLRAAPGRTFKPGDAPPARLEQDGSGVQEALFFDKVDRGGVLREVSAWFEKHFDQVLDLHQLGDTAYLSLSPCDAAALRIPLADTGEGIAQVLPVLVAIAMARKAAEYEPQLLALEQPELHLHPKAELALAQHLAETAASKSPPTVVLETHSENLLLGIQLQVAEGRIPVDAIGVNWIERCPDGRALVRPIEIDHEGQVHGWPHGVFSEDIDLLRRLYMARRSLRDS